MNYITHTIYLVCCHSLEDETPSPWYCPDAVYYTNLPEAEAAATELRCRGYDTRVFQEEVEFPDDTA